MNYSILRKHVKQVMHVHVIVFNIKIYRFLSASLLINCLILKVLKHHYESVLLEKIAKVPAFFTHIILLMSLCWFLQGYSWSRRHHKCNRYYYKYILFLALDNVLHEACLCRQLKSTEIPYTACQNSSRQCHSWSANALRVSFNCAVKGKHVL